MDGPTGAGIYSGAASLSPGLWAYKIVYDQGGSTQWVIDPSQGRRKYVGGLENSAIKVPDCRLPSFTVVASEVGRPAAKQGHYHATLAVHDGIEGTGLDPQGIEATLLADGQGARLASPSIAVSPAGAVTIALDGLADGKYRLTLTATTRNARASEPFVLTFWLEPEAFSWQDALIYLIVTDRYRDGDPSNNPKPTPSADPSADYWGGDLEGVRQSIAEGTFDKLGVRALWLTPFTRNPEGAFLASDGVHSVTGYHGYWPIRGREVDARLGGEAALHALVTEAHRHGIRVFMDYVIHHVHQEHEYLRLHPGWFRSDGCVCGTADCDWTAHAEDCVFTQYLPNIDHTVPEANAAVVADAVWWVGTFNLDGLRIDAAKQVPQAAIQNLATELRDTFEHGGADPRVFLLGETAMGWNDCADPCNDENYGFISKNLGSHGLDGQFDFVLYYAAATTVFAYGDRGMMHADYWYSHGASKYPSGAIMTPYLGSHDTPRFTTLADYRGQDATHGRDVPSRSWNGIATAPSESEAYDHTRIAFSWLLGLPGAPLLYYGDEYGQWGGADPNNRTFWVPEAGLDLEQAKTLALVRRLGTARRSIAPLRRGSYVSLGSTEDALVFGRLVAPGDAAIVGLTRSSVPVTITVSVGRALGLPPLSTLHDALGGPDATIAINGTVAVTIPARSSVILTP